jgi:predicted SAM-dependent methyltransferase
VLQATWEAVHVSKHFGKSIRPDNGNAEFKYHVFATGVGPHDLPAAKARKVPIRTEQVAIQGGITGRGDGWGRPDAELKKGLSSIKGGSDGISGHQRHPPKKRTRENKSKTHKKTETPKSGAKEEDKEDEYAPLPADLYTHDGPLLLNIGGVTLHKGWLNVNSHAVPVHSQTPGHRTDIVREMNDLEGIRDDSVSAIYSSHTLEHAGYGESELQGVLREWHRVLQPDGLVMISVPCMPVLAEMYIDPVTTFEQRWFITRMMFGAQVDDKDYHKVGFERDLLLYFLNEAGFCEIQHVESFNLFHDTSEMEYLGRRISLNMLARKCDKRSAEERAASPHYRVAHRAILLDADGKRVPSRQERVAEEDDEDDF